MPRRRSPPPSPPQRDGPPAATARRAFAASFVLACLPAAAARAQIVTADAGVASPELPSVRTIVETLHTTTVDDVRLLLDGTWSPRTDLELRARVPFTWRSIHAGVPSAGTVDGDLAGFGDASLRAKYALVRDDDVMQSDRLSLLGEVSFPTGEHHEEVDGVELPRRLQLGAGSYGFGLGPVFTIVRDRHRASAELGWRRWLEHGGFEHGDELRANLAWWYRLSPAAFAPGAGEAEYRLVAEVLARHTFADRAAGTSSGNDGGEAWALLGLQVNVSPATRLEAGVMVPVWQDVDDAFGTRKLGIEMSWSVFF